jgi:hypothetical protein
MRIVTSFGPNRIERLQKCVRSWLNLGCDVTAVQSPGETGKFQQLFPDVQFVETQLVGDLFGRPHSVRLKPMIEQAINEPVLIMNSDIDISSAPAEFAADWEVPCGKVLKMGVRWDYLETTGETHLLKYGIDAFLITPEMRKCLPDIGMTIGCPAWDYWIPWQLHTCGYTFETKKTPGLRHALHPKAWSDNEYQIGIGLMRKYYHLTNGMLSFFIQETTGRQRLRPWRKAIA